MSTGHLVTTAPSGHPTPTQVLRVLMTLWLVLGASRVPPGCLASSAQIVQLLKEPRGPKETKTRTLGGGRRVGVVWGLQRVSNLSSSPRTFLVLALKVAHPWNPRMCRQTGQLVTWINNRGESPSLQGVSGCPGMGKAGGLGGERASWSPWGW